MNTSNPSRTGICPWLKHKAGAIVGVIAIAMLMSGMPPAGVEAASGDLDTGFGAGGKVTTDFSGNADFAYAIAIQGDGKIVAAGGAINNTTITDFALARYNIDGSLDTSFGTGGKVTTNFGGIDEARGVAIQGDGKIVAAGITFNSNIGTSDFALARYNSDGSLDVSFGAGGKVTTNFTGSDAATSLAIQGGGKIIVAGNVLNDGTSLDFALARYNSDGSLDASFGAGGKVVTDFFTSPDFASAVAIQADGKIVAAGRARTSDKSDDFALARYGVSSFDQCLQVDSGSDLFMFNLATGDYQFTDCAGFTVSGTGRVTTRGSTIILEHSTADRNVMAKLDRSAQKGTVLVRLFSPARTFTISDRSTSNNSCSCQ